MYKDGQVADKVFIVRKGEFELERKMVKSYTDTTSQVLELLGRKQKEKCVLAQKLPEIKDIPGKLKLSIFGVGSIVGEEDVINRENYSCSLKCISLTGKLFVINKVDFFNLRNNDESWLGIIEKILMKEKRRDGDLINKSDAK